MTPTQQSDPLAGVSQPKVNEKPKLALTGVIEKVGEPSDTSSGNYTGVEIFLKSTRGSRKLFPRMYFRPEMFSFPEVGNKASGLDADGDYTNNQKHIPFLSSINPKNGKTMGQTFESTYGMNVMPRLKKKQLVDERGHVILDKYEIIGIEQHTPFSAIAGGTLAGLRALVGMFKTALAALPDTQKGEFGFKEFTPEQIVAILNEYIQASGGAELGILAKQSKDQSGELTDKYEVDRYQGAFTSEVAASNERTRVKNAGKAVGQRLVIGYSE